MSFVALMARLRGAAGQERCVEREASAGCAGPKHGCAPVATAEVSCRTAREQGKPLCEEFKACTGARCSEVAARLLLVYDCAAQPVACRRGSRSAGRRGLGVCWTGLEALDSESPHCRVSRLRDCDALARRSRWWA